MDEGEREMDDVERAREIKLYCPAVSKMEKWEARDGQRLELGSIAKVFGLEPSTIKLNGHFISRGVDLLASCVTWRSLLSLFYAKGLSTGKDDGDALIVDGKLCKVRDERCEEGEAPVARYSSSHGLKRQQSPENKNPYKKQKVWNDTKIIGRSEDVRSQKNWIPNSSWPRPFKISFLKSSSLKRPREDELFTAEACNKKR